MKKTFISTVFLCIGYYLSAQNTFPSTGNTGIGTLSPLTALHISGGKEIITSTDYTYGQLQVLNPDDAEASISIAANGSGTVLSRTTYARQWLFGIGCYASGLNNLVISNPTLLGAGFVFSYDGNLGIGTNDTKGYRLAVNGSAVFTQVVVKAFANWPDYVFHKSYSLTPLPELEKFIGQNQHLPEVPSAAEIEKNGVDITANQAVLLKKIEELTLYLIEQNKKIEEQQRKMEALEKALSKK